MRREEIQAAAPKAAMEPLTHASPKVWGEALVTIATAGPISPVPTRDPKKEIALDAVKQPPTQQLKPEHTQSTGMRI